MNNQSTALTVIPAELKNQLPIFQVLGDKLPAPVTSVKTRKTLASVFYWALILGGAWWFFKNLDTLLEFAQKSILFVVFSIVLLVLLMLAPKLITVLHKVGKMILFKSEKAIIRNNPVIALQMLLNDARETLKRVKEKISNVDGVRIDMIQSGTVSQKSAEDKYSLAEVHTHCFL